MSDQTENNMPARITEEEFARQLQKQLRRKQRPRLQKTVLLEDYNKELILEALTEEEMKGIISAHNTDEAVAKALVYQGCPSLRQTAADLLRLESIKEPMGVLDALRSPDIARMAQIITVLSADYNAPRVEEIEDTKNS